MHLSQLGAEVIRIDPLGGGPDYNRWPLSPSGNSLYWEGLNKGKKSVALNLRESEGRDLAARIATAPGAEAGMFVTNMKREGLLSHEILAARRHDMITARVSGWPNGRTAVDYTVNAATGLPYLTGPEDYAGPINHVLPAWDLLAGMHVAMALMAAHGWRRQTGQGAEIEVPLSAVAFASLGHLGQIAEATVQQRHRIGNDLFGAYGRDFRTADGVDLMVVVVTGAQWKALCGALKIEAGIKALEERLGTTLATDRSRFEHRAAIDEIVGTAIAAHSLADLSDSFSASGVCWEQYSTLRSFMEAGEGLGVFNDLFTLTDHPSQMTYPTPGHVARFLDVPASSVKPAPTLGADTERVLGELLGITSISYRELADRGIVA